MALDRTQQQSSNELEKARDMSLEPTRPPAQVAGYQLLKFLGSGAYGEVWSANDLKTGRRVAIKFYTRRTSADVQLLASEVAKLAVLAADRYVVQLLNVGWDADPPYYVMDYLEHGSLEDRLSSSAGMPSAEAIELFQELANGLLHLHGKGILHCDLKPGNVMLDQDGKPRVADFGQSRLSTEVTAALGTLFYMAPEQADLDAVPDARWDVYGLGALLFSMLTGQPPYYCAKLAHEIETADDLHGRLQRYRDGLFAANKPVEHRAIAGVDRALAEIIDRCIAANPHKRFSNIQSVLLALRQRELAQARRPLMILGLLGPLLLIGGMTLFGLSAFRQTIDRTQAEITKKARDSNRFAARLAARSAAEQIDEYFRIVRQLSRDAELLATLDRVLIDAELQKLRIAIADPATNGLNYQDSIAARAELAKSRQDFCEHPLRQQLQPFLERRLFDRTGEFPLVSSWFICDRYGNQLASAFRTQNSTLGKNYSYRTYFTGLDQDLKPNSVDSPELDANHSDEAVARVGRRQIIDRPHLSAVFISEQSNTWKVAFSTPLLIAEKVVGIVAVTVDLGNFVDFENVKNHYAMMVDSRAGDNQGIVLEHPLFKKILQEQGKIPAELARCTVDLGQVKETKRFFDPVGNTELGKVMKYNSESLVASAPVKMSGFVDANAVATEKTESKKVQTGFVVLAVEDFASVVKPANELSGELERLAGLASLFLLAVTVGMWFFVRQMMQESRQRLERAFSPSSESSSLKDRETVPDGRHVDFPTQDHV